MKVDRTLLRASLDQWISSEPRVGPWWLPWVWTLLLSLALAAVFTVIGFITFGSGEGAWRNLPGWAYWYGKNLIVSLTVAGLIHLLFDAGRQWFATPRRLARWSRLQRTLYFAGVPLLGVVVGWPLGLALAGLDVVAWLARPENANLIAGSLLLSLGISAVLHLFFSAQARKIVADKRATEAQLRLLQAQIEPHFLFNTLANVISLMDHDGPRAKHMLEAFTDYLRSSLATLRADESPLSQELALAQRYLQLLQARMEDRLHFSIDADEAARAQPLPPLLLQPLVENAVVHGLEPSVDGGTVRVSARVQGDRLLLEVADDGRGLDAPPRLGARSGAGLALVNIRQRLLARYGASATLDVLATHPGTLARINLPMQTPSSCPQP